MKAYSVGLLFLTGAMTLAALPAASQAGPLGNASVVRQAAPGSIVEQAARRCWWRHGVRHCGRVVQRGYRDRPDGYGFTYGNPKAEFYPIGSRDWWSAMEREGRTGRPRG